MPAKFTEVELEYLRGQRLGRLATVDALGAPQNNPVGFAIDEEADAILIGGLDLGATRKFRNVRRNPNVALVVDDLASVDPWHVRGVEIRGRAEALIDVDPPYPGMSREAIRITPDWVASWGFGSDGLEIRGRRSP
jgi:pyridoxamine 5'-phosphate oxidase family protein